MICPVASFVMVTGAFATTAPVGSVMVPAMSPDVVVWPNAESPNVRTASKTKTMRFTACILLIRYPSGKEGQKRSLTLAGGDFAASAGDATGIDGKYGAIRSPETRGFFSATCERSRALNIPEIECRVG